MEINNTGYSKSIRLLATGVWSLPDKAFTVFFDELMRQIWQGNVNPGTWIDDFTELLNYHLHVRCNKERVD